MIVIEDYKQCPQIAKGSAIALGNFDGVHRGHVAVIEKSIEIARLSGTTSSVLTFEPHPLNILKSNAETFRLTTSLQKMNIIEKLGVDNLFVINFTKALSEMKANDFINKILVGSLNAKHIITGEDFIFGHNREGNASLLLKSAKEYGFEYSRVLAIGGNDAVFSSTLIRKHLKDGNLKEAKLMLGRNFMISGIVEEGNKKGRTIGFPTINIDLGEYIRPAFGVYAAKVTINGHNGSYNGAVNIGVRPTIDGKKTLLEMHIFDFSENIYGLNVEVELIEYVRKEHKFESLEQLSKQITEDCNKIRKILS